MKVERFILLKTESNAIYVGNESCIYLRVPVEVRRMLKSLGLDMTKRTTYDVECLLTIEEEKFSLVYTIIPKTQRNNRTRSIIIQLKRLLKLNGG